VELADVVSLAKLKKKKLCMNSDVYHYLLSNLVLHTLPGNSIFVCKVSQT
jgi:hypothetical protein